MRGGYLDGSDRRARLLSPQKKCIFTLGSGWIDSQGQLDVTISPFLEHLGGVGVGEHGYGGRGIPYVLPPRL